MDSLNNPDKWLPPRTVLTKMASLIDLKIEYLLSVGQHDACLPNFLARGCLKKTSTGQIEYDFGVDCNISNLQLASTLNDVNVTPKKKKKRSSVKTPQGGLRKKKSRITTIPSMASLSTSGLDGSCMSVPCMHSTPSK
jgi:hypothetical protein